MKVNYAGCAICDSTWGQLHAEILGQSFFFCCAICEVQFRGLVERIRQATGWSDIDSLEIEGTRQGRRCIARRGESVFHCAVAFTPLGAIRKFSVS